MERLLPWYDATKRDLPWRRTADPYAVLVSELMCQQTRVDTAIGYYQAWMARWPTPDDLANASDEAVHAAWSGLGYYQRARNLHAAAKQIAATGWPDDLQDLPGVGPYTAAAVGSIAFGKPMAVVDGNVQRVLSRWHDIGLEVDRAAGKQAIQAAADVALDASRPGDWNQAVMELGALICTPRPDCKICPVATNCAALANDTVAQRPVKQPKKRPSDEHLTFGYAQRHGKVLLTRRGDGLLAGTWGLPEVEGGPVLGTAIHRFTHRTWHMTIVAAEAQAGTWVPLSDLSDWGLSTAARRAIEAAQRKT